MVLRVEQVPLGKVVPFKYQKMSPIWVSHINLLTHSISILTRKL